MPIKLPAFAMGIGAAEGKFKVPEMFDEWDKEIEEMFGGEI